MIGLTFIYLYELKFLFLKAVVRKENKITLLSYQKHINISFNNGIILTKYGSSQLCEQNVSRTSDIGTLS